eukprot:TRINITY_DN7803_c1_g1_i1.p1 TRINITY_DN7803_c1_g1~~TRINITY_DN7803_c1_g1_i1.p1  ORF type:complete len:546 (-),score=122.70 TRINITY_DN7803_c1_g1_i1:52-1689(-)
MATPRSPWGLKAAARGGYELAASEAPTTVNQDGPTPLSVKSSRSGRGAGLMRRSGSAQAAKPSGNMYVSITVAMVGAMMFGLDQGNFGNVQTFDSFVREWCIGNYGTEITCSHEYTAVSPNEAWDDGFVLWGATLITFGAALGALVLGPLVTNKLGRRPCVGLGGLICFAGCLLASYLSKGSVSVFFSGRFITGFGVGVSCFALPVYNSEISTPGLRGATGSLFQLNVVVGCFISCLITLFNKDWKFGILLPGVAGALLTIAAPFIPESPRYVMERHGFDAGIRELQRVRVGDVSMEAQEMKDAIDEARGEKALSFPALFAEPNLRKRVIIACVLVAAQQATGVNAFLGYAGTIFEKVGIRDPVLFNAVFNCIMILGCVAGLLLVDSPYGGRKRQLLLATAIMGPPLVLSGAALQQNWNGMITMVCVCIYGVGFQFAWGTIPWIYPAEIFRMSEKESAVSLAVFVNYMNNAFVIIATPYVMHWSVPGTMYFFGVLNLLCGLFVCRFIRETKGVPLEDVPSLFSREDWEEDDEDEDEEEEDSWPMD